VGQQLTLSGASITTINFQAGGYVLLDGFHPDTAREGDAAITDRFDAWALVPGGGTLHDMIEPIHRALAHAALHKTDADGIYLNYAIVAGESTWRTRVTGGVVLYDSRLANRWIRGRIKLAIVLTHAPWWEGAEAQIPLTNANGTNNTSGLTVYNHWDGDAGHENYVSINAADVDGDLPGATRLQLLNNFATDRLYDIWIGQNWTTPSTFGPTLEGESATGGSLGNDASCSGGQYRYRDLLSGADSALFTWTLSTNFLNDCRGRGFKILCRFYDGNVQFLSNLPNIRWWLKLVYTATTIWESAQVSADPDRTILIRDLFTMRLPPWLPGQTGLNAIDMTLMARQDTGLTLSAGIDFLHAIPVEGWRYITHAGYGTQQNRRVMDDGIEGALYTDDGSGTGKLGILVGYGQPIMVYPNKLQRLYFLMHSHLANTAEIARTVSAKLYYRPRRRNL